jgi:hypothetical protein
MYRIEVLDPSGLRLAVFEDVPLLEARRAAPDQPDRVLGLVPASVAHLSHADVIRVWVEGALFCEARVVAVRAHWSDTRKLILEKYVRFHEIVEIEAQRPARWGDGRISRAFVNKTPDAIVRDAINATPGPIHYLIDHSAYPDGAQREFSKFTSRKRPEAELGVGGITSGDWVGAPRLDASGAYAKDGDTISGLVVDGIAWPDLRLMMVDTEETAKNAHAVKRHPEIAEWTTAQYHASGYKLAAEAAKAFLQSLIDGEGIDYVELNPHRDITGAYDDRVDAYGRYVGLVYGGGLCFNAALVESGHSDVYLYNDGAYHVPEMALKEYFSYTGPARASIAPSAALVAQVDFTGMLFELVTMAGYLAGGYGWHVDARGALYFRSPERVDRVFHHDPIRRGVALGSRSQDIVNIIYFHGNPLYSTLEKTYARSASITRLGAGAKGLRVYAIVQKSDADLLAEAVLDDLAYPEVAGALTFYHGAAAIQVGDLVEVRGAPFRRLEAVLAGAWGGRHDGALVGRVKEVVHRFMGMRVETRVVLTSPLRSVANPLSFMVRSQPTESALFQFRLDDANVGADLGYHLD